ncbi:MAG: hypothetical protein WHT06_08150 [Desulfobacterales bacterium]
MKERRPWFPAKRCGWGWGFPVSRQGWAVLALFVGLTLLGALWLSPGAGRGALHGYPAGLAVLFSAVCGFKGGRRVGKKKDRGVDDRPHQDP